MAERKFPTWATMSIPDIGNGDPSVVDPGAAKQETGWGIEKPLLQTMNWLQNLFGHFIRANNEFKIRPDLYEAEAGEIINLDNTLNNVTGFLPLSPKDGQWVAFGGVESFSINSVIVDGNGKHIMSSGTTGIELDINHHMFIFYWRESENVWHINLGISKGEVR